MLGVLSDTSPSDLFVPDSGEPVRPGDEGPHFLSPTDQRAISHERLLSAAIAGAERDLAAAITLAESHPSSTTFAALSQAHALLGQGVDAIRAARRALALSVEVPTWSDGILDPIAARIACEVMLRFDAKDEAFQALSQVDPLPGSLRIVFASLALELGQPNVALDSLEGEMTPLAESLRGYILAAQNDFQSAIPHLRGALRMAPEDVAAAMNLSVALWNLGSRKKAVSAALRASRTAPGRKDASLHYLELLLEMGETRRLSEEIASLRSRNLVADARFTVIQARALIAKGEAARSLPLLEAAISQAREDGPRQDVLRVEVEVNLAVLKFRLGRRTYGQTMDTLSRLLRKYPDHEAVVLGFARTTTSATDAPLLRNAIERLEERLLPVRRAMLRYQLATLEGDNQTAGAAAHEWFELDPNDSHAACAAVVALGIGLERWSEAESIADFAIRKFPNDRVIVNNSAYVLAMAGRPKEAIRLLQSRADHDFVFRATLGLAHLAAGELDTGMRLYRQAASQAEKEGTESLSLMVAYQALVMRQLGVDEAGDPTRVSALALAPVPLPDDWAERSEFLRLRGLCRMRGYTWPLAI